MTTTLDLTFFVLLFLLAGWLYRSWRSLSELRHAPVLRIAESRSPRSRVSVLIPAKNEEKNIADCIRPLLAQLRDGDELIVINNGSSDRTETVVKELGAIKIENQIPFSPSLAKKDRGGFFYLNTPPTPEGWTGKNYALDLGVRHASGDWLLFTDADTRHAPGSVDATVSFAVEKKLDLLTLLPRCLAQGFWENLIQPCAMGYMGLWFPVRKINDPRASTHFANGQYLLIRGGHYRKIGGHEGVRQAFLEDFALMKKTKAAGASGMCAFGMELYGTRMYDSWGALWRGWRRIFLHAFEQKPASLARCVLSVFFFSVYPVAALCMLPFRLSASLLLCLLLVALILATALKACGIVRARKPYALLHPLAALIFAAILFDSFRMALFRRPTYWR